MTVMTAVVGSLSVRRRRARLRFASLAGAVETTGADGAVYGGASGGGTQSTQYGYGSTIVIPSRSDGWFQARVRVLNPGAGLASAIVGLATVDTNTSFSAYAYGLHADQGAPTPYTYRVVTAGALGNTANLAQVVRQDGDVLRLRRNGSSVIAEVSRGGDQAFVPVHVWTADGGTALFPRFAIGAQDTQVQAPAAD